LLALQWDSPAASAGGPGSPNDVDVYLTDDPPTRVLASSTDSNIGLDPVEVISFQNNSRRTTKFNLLIVNAGGANPGKIKYVRFGHSTLDEYDTKSSTSYGHANAVGAEAVGAAYWQDTPAFGTNPPQLESFSSVGGTPILFDVSGNRLSSPEIRFKPNVVGPDGGSTTFFYSSDSDGDGFRDFFGTSASAPHVAGVAALMLEANPGLLPLDIFSAMEATAVDMDDPGTPGFDTGVDFATGYGLVQADAAIAGISAPECNVHADPLALNFGSQNVGTSQSLAVNLSNSGRANCNVTAISLTGSGDFQFAPTPPVTPLILTPGDSLAIAVEYTPSGEGPDSGTLTINSDDPDQGTLPVSLNGSGVIVRTADLSIVKTDSADPVTQGDTITYQITVTNNGPDDATGVIMQDTLPPEVTLVSTPGCAVSGQLVTCNLPNLTLGAQAILDIVVTADSAGAITNEASVSGNEVDPVPGNNTVFESTQVDAGPVPSVADLSIRKDANQSRPRVGSTLGYTITVTNNGPANATGIVIVDTLPSSVSFAGSQECSSDGAPVGGTVTCNIDSIVNGGAKSVSISVKLNSKGTIENRVTVSGNEQDPDLSNNQATRRTRVR